MVMNKFSHYTYTFFLSLLSFKKNIKFNFVNFIVIYFVSISKLLVI